MLFIIKIALLLAASMPIAASARQSSAPAAAQGKSWAITQGRTAAERAKLWREDLKQLATELPKNHKNLFFNIKKEDFDKEVAAIDAKIEKLPDGRLLVELMRLVARVGDSHTSLQWTQASPALHRYGYELGWFGDGIFIIAATENAQYVGSEVVKIGDVPAAEAMLKITEVFGCENEATRLSWAPRHAAIAEILSGLGLAKDASTVTLELKSAGKTEKVTFRAVEQNSKLEWKTNFDGGKTPLPLRLKKRGTYWTELVPGTKILYIQYNQCVNAPDLPMAQFARTVEGFFDKLNIEKVIVDLRFNGGGDSQVARPLIDTLKNSKFNEKGKLFVFVGRGTFSSAQLNASEFRRETKAVLVGEPTGQRPNHYGEMRKFELANTGLVVTYSTKYFKSSPTDEPSLMPDVKINYLSKDYFAGIDPPMDLVMAGKIAEK